MGVKNILSDNKNELRLSQFNELSSSITFKPFSSKFVVSGEEIFTTDKKHHLLKEGEYLTSNHFTEASMLIDSSLPVKGICLDFSIDTIKDVIDFQKINATDFFNFVQNQKNTIAKYNATNTMLGFALEKIANVFDDIFDGSINLKSELFYSLAECKVFDLRKKFNNFTSLNSVKEETNLRLFHFVYDAKLFIDAHYLERINIEDIATEARLSEYHFIRLFKQAFNTTPYQYMIKKRLLHAQELLLSGTTIDQIIHATGFSDAASFSKAFKSQFGSSPRQFKNQIGSY